MAKQVPYILIVLSMVLLLAGCGAKAEHQTILPSETGAVTETTHPIETEVPVEEPTEVPTEEPTEAPTQASSTESSETEAAASSLPYLQRIDRADQSIYSGPGYDYGFAGTVRERGSYTIVEETWDWEGNLWGKLKSGAGWVNLSEIRSDDYAAALISANYADDNLLLHGDYHHCSGPDPEYCISVAFRAYGTLRDVALFSFVFSGDQFILGEDFFTLPEMSEDMPLVAELAFPGDMSTYGIRFTDENGTTHFYSIYISGRNGALLLEPYEP